ncbi:hypothetical protein F2Q69_00047586 [Brassica cretica]|uniref:Uncharacterized protein n=1 Tax=Brassica cretica TaxID=69181 RepID=A0A8S9PX01_BRACR|nr:hypothetical protein F2Q69_00047586 [Brassica cretica]
MLLTITGKNSPPCSCSFSPSSHVRLSGFIDARFSSGSSFHQILPLKVWIVFSSVYVLWAWKIVSGLKLGLWFFGGWLPFSLPQVVSLLPILHLARVFLLRVLLTITEKKIHLRTLVLLHLFLLFWLMLGTASPLVGSQLVVFDVVFLIVGWPPMTALWFADSFYLSFPLCFLISLQLSSLLASLVAFPFAMFDSPSLDSVALWAWKIISCFKLGLWFLSGSWSFSHFYPELCGSSLALALGLSLFTLQGVSYLLVGGCASGV